MEYFFDMFPYLILFFPLFVIISVGFFPRLYTYLFLVYRFLRFEIISIFREILSTPGNNSKLGKIQKYSNHCKITYYDNDDHKKRKLFIPLRADNLLAMNECTVEAFSYDEQNNPKKVLTLKQDPEIPILVSARCLDVDYIAVTNNFNGEQKIFRGEEQVVCFTSD